MPDSHYIEIDEEIISAVGRLRKSSEAENIFVFPKRALILQSIINLKLLGREAEKLGKTVIVMTQDEQGLRLAEKAGLRVQEYQDRVLREHRSEAATRFTVRHGENIPMPEVTDLPDGRRRSSEIGTDSFSGPAVQPQTPAQPAPRSPAPAAEEKTGASLRVRNLSPPIQTALNSKTGPTSPTVSVLRTGPTLATGVVPNDISPAERIRKEKLRRMFEGKSTSGNAGALVRPPTAYRNQPSNQTASAPPSSKPGIKKWLWLGLTLMVLAGGLVGGYYFLQPEAVIAIEPQSSTQTVKLALVGSTESDAENQLVPVRYVETEKTIRLSHSATGTDTSKSQAKANGTIIIQNAFSDAPQPLVATTRFETADGKLYRLVTGVTVPGTTVSEGKPVPGQVEAKVLADQPGAQYNIRSGSMTLPGFKGSPKYEKITAVVKGDFTGGSDDESAVSLSVSGTDLEAARNAARDEARKSALSDFSQELQAGEVVLEPGIQVTPLGEPSAPLEGTRADTFEYEGRYRVQGFLVMEAAIRERIAKQAVVTDGVTLQPFTYDLVYQTAFANFETKRVDIPLEVDVVFRAPLDESLLRQGLLGLDEAGIRTYLTEHPEVKRLQVEFKPKVFIRTIPSNPERVKIQILDPANE